jgi:hypothetical protein
MFSSKYANPEQLTLTGERPINSKMIDVSCGAKSHRALTSPGPALNQRRADIADVAEFAPQHDFFQLGHGSRIENTCPTNSKLLPAASMRSAHSAQLVAARQTQTVVHARGKLVMSLSGRGDDRIDTVVPQHFQRISKADNRRDCTFAEFASRSRCATRLRNP